jgi:hypothetical protein
VGGTSHGPSLERDDQSVPPGRSDVGGARCATEAPSARIPWLALLEATGITWCAKFHIMRHTPTTIVDRGSVSTPRNFALGLILVACGGHGCAPAPSSTAAASAAGPVRSEVTDAGASVDAQTRHAVEPGGAASTGAFDPQTPPKATPWIAYTHPIAQRIAPIFEISIAKDGLFEVTDSSCIAKGPVTAQLTAKELAELAKQISNAKLVTFPTDHLTLGEGDPYVGAPQLVITVTENGHTTTSKYIRFKAPAALVAVGDLLERLVDSHRMLKSAATSNGKGCWCSTTGSSNDVACK